MMAKNSKIFLGCLVVAVVLTIAVAIMVGGWWVSTYDRLVALEEEVDQAWSQVENVYQRRADLIPNLVATVKGARDFEQETLTQVVEARAKVGQVNLGAGDAPSAEQMARFQEAQSGLSSALSRLLVVVERYPELRATENFRDLQIQIEGAENRIAVERRRYNEAARDLNRARRGFFARIVAKYYEFEEKPYYEADPGAEVAPEVDFGSP